MFYSVNYKKNYKKEKIVLNSVAIFSYKTLLMLSQHQIYLINRPLCYLFIMYNYDYIQGSDMLFTQFIIFFVDDQFVTPLA